MPPGIEIDLEKPARQSGNSYTFVSAQTVTNSEEQTLLSASFEFDGDEGGAEPASGKVTLVFTQHDWAAFRAYMDSKLAAASRS